MLFVKQPMPLSTLLST